jgi:hypothetical protein
MCGIKDVFQVFFCGISIDVLFIPERHIGPYAAMGETITSRSI